MSNKKTLVLGASQNPERYSHKAIQKLRAYGHNVVAIGNREGKVADVPVVKTSEPYTDIDTVTLYMNATNQHPYEAYILSLQPKRIIFNPGAENKILAAKAAAQNIKVLEACTLVMLATDQY